MNMLKTNHEDRHYLITGDTFTFMQYTCLWCISWVTWLFTQMWGTDKYHNNLMWILCNNWHFLDKFLLYLICPSIWLLVETFRSFIAFIMQSAPDKIWTYMWPSFSKETCMDACVFVYDHEQICYEKGTGKLCEEITKNISQRQPCISFEGKCSPLHFVTLHTSSSNIALKSSDPSKSSEPTHHHPTPWR